MRRFRVLSCLVAVATVLTGCATVPTSSTPHVISTVRTDPQPEVEQAPIAGREPDLLVRDFISASSAQRGQHRVARQYLTGEGSQRWDDRTSTTILTNVDTLYDVRAENRVTILLRADRVGTLSGDGTYNQDQGTYEARLTLLKVDGQWRIDALPSGVVLERADFLARYQRVPVYFLNPDQKKVVADPRWVARDSDSLAARLVELLIGGPNAQLASGVVNKLGQGVRLRSNVTTATGESVPGAGEANGVGIDLGGLESLDAGQRQLLAAQVVWTLDSAGVRGPYVLLADGAPLDERYALGWDTADVASFDPSSSSGADVGLHAVSGGSLVKVVDGSVNAVGGPLGRASSLESAAISHDGQQVAAVTMTGDPRPGGQVQLLVGSLGGAVAVAASGTEMTRPTWSGDDRAAWVVVDTGTVVRVVREPSSGQVSSSPVDSGAVTALGGPISALRLSRDGVRAALIVGGRVYVAVVTRAQNGGFALTSPVAVAPDLGDGAVSLDWTSADTLVVSGRGDEVPVVTVGVDGALIQPLPSRNLSPPVRYVAAAPASSVLAADSRAVLQLNVLDAPGERYWREVAGLGGGSSTPILPG
ncbi:MtrAB system accessory lipoprotein LpqB [Rhodococcus sp. X156]|uniref:MtrAB system accessory lipoprotein LpqB n=1 Tax=Rhodococcus sp. X156 TaxID=2499145 RepID=UPI000FD74E66|nr:MtrAB system accessory lipoprotein LpqB [Rhodococcus sp. X156]